MFSFLKISTGILGACLFLVSVSQAVPLRNSANGNPTGNRHDFSKDNIAVTIRATEEDRVCIFCHTPHGASPQSTLWNRPSPTAANAFALYSSGTLVIDDPAVQANSQYDNSNTDLYPNGSTRLCMSCHDGAVAVGEILNGQIPGGDAILSTVVSGAAVIDLATSHPVSFVYKDGLSAVLNDINTAKGAGAFRFPTRSDIPLDGQGRMQCTTCHDPHNDTREDDPAQPPFWRHVVAGDAAASYNEVCVDCHFGSGYPARGTNH